MPPIGSAFPGGRVAHGPLAAHRVERDREPVPLVARPFDADGGRDQRQRARRQAVEELLHARLPQSSTCARPFETTAAFDVVICEQVLEHVADPCAAAWNLRELCVPGGHVIVSTPFLVKIHELPALALDDYWRFTPRGLRTLLERAGLHVDEVGTWGNGLCVTGNLSRWSGYRRWHPLGNEPDVPLHVWAFARSPR